MDRYEEALERAKKGLPIDEVFPELKEDEDERIRRCIEVALTDVDEQRFKDFGTTLKECIAYLEKQKEVKWSPSECEMGVLYKLCYVSNQITDEDDTELTRLYQDLKREYFNGHSFENMFPKEKHKEPKPIFRVGDYVRNIKTGDKVLIEQLDIATKIYCYVSKDGVAEIHSDFPFSKQNEWEVIGQQVEQKPESCDCSRDEESYTNGIHHVLMNPEAYGLIKQKPAEWSEEDERTLESFLGWLQGSMGEKTYSSWLKSLPERFSLKPKQEWSEEDNNALVLFHELISFGYTENFFDAQTAEDMRRWLNERLKSTRPQPHWKPSKVQMKALNEVANDGVLLDLFNDLLKLL